MKKAFVILLMLIYGFSSTGTTISLHYCCGKLNKVSFTPAVKKGCVSKKMEASGCCKSKHISLKVKDDQEVGLKWLPSSKSIAALSFVAPSVIIHPFRRKIPGHYTTGPPLALSSIPLFIKNQVFRI